MQTRTVIPANSSVTSEIMKLSPSGLTTCGIQILMKLIYYWKVVISILAVLIITALLLYDHLLTISENSHNESFDKTIVGAKDLPVRIFEEWKYPFPCYQKQQERKWYRMTYETGFGKDLAGLVYVKVPKTGSSTLSGIALRIAHRHKVDTMANTSFCAVSWNHIPAQEFNMTSRNRRKSFFWTVLREPTSRVISSFYFHNRRKGEDFYTYKNFTEYMNIQFKRKILFKDLQFIAPNKKISIQSYEKDFIEKDWKESIHEILQSYDFIGITERIDESLVAFRLLLGLDAGDILYFSSKVSGGYDFNCNHIPTKKVLPELDNYLKSNEWKKLVSYSNILYMAANKSLDLTIKKIGSRFDEALKEHKYLLSLAHEICVNRTIFPCSAIGEEQHNMSKYHCYDRDYGCGYLCLDELYYNYTQGKVSNDIKN